VKGNKLKPLRFKKQHPGLTFKIGFHAVPSMKQIHMHLISQGKIF